MLSNNCSNRKLSRGLKRFSSLLGLSAGLAVFPLNSFASCTYSVDNEWNTGFVASITIKNDTGAAINNWNLNWQYNTNRITSSWNTNLTGSNPYNATNLSWNSSIAVGHPFRLDSRATKMVPPPNVQR